MTMKKLDTYFGLCTEVYDLSKPEPPKDAYSFYRSYIDQANGTILEPMCGTGRFLLPLLEEGFNISGFDASDNMLTALYVKAKLKNLHPNVWKSFIEDLARQERYDLIFIPSGSFSLIIDYIALQSSLKKIYNHLTDGGIFIFEVETFKSVPPLGIWRGASWQRADGKTIMLSSCAMLDGNICSSIGKYELIDHNKIINTEIEELKVRLYESSELITLLEQAGFKEIYTKKAFDRAKAPDPDDEVIVYECKK